MAQPPRLWPSGRLAACAALLWAGMLLTLALLAAPSVFAVLTHDQAGRVAARFFQQEAHASLALGALLVLLLRWAGRGAAATASPFNVELMLVLGAVFCTVAGYFALQPTLAAARAGQTAWPFAAWHGVSMAFFALKGLLVLALGWRLSLPARLS